MGLNRMVFVGVPVSAEGGLLPIIHLSESGDCFVQQPSVTTAAFNHHQTISQCGQLVGQFFHVAHRGGQRGGVVALASLYAGYQVSHGWPPHGDARFRKSSITSVVIAWPFRSINTKCRTA